MRVVRLVLCLVIIGVFVSCSSKGRDGTGMGEDERFAEGNIPVAQAGTVLADVNFEFDSSAIDSRSQAILGQHAQWLKGGSGTIVIEGHCDERGTNEYNMALGERRARATYEYLRNLGVAPDRMNTISYGEELPLDPRSDEAAWAKNRRAHFALK